MSSRRSVRQLLVAVLLGVLVGGGLMAVTPAGAEVAQAAATSWKKIWKKELKPLADKRYYQKSQSDTKYASKAEAAAAAAAAQSAATSASNSATDSKLGGYYKKTETDAKYAPYHAVVKGTWGFQVTATAADGRGTSPISFPTQLAAAPTLHVIEVGDAPPAGCSGTAAAPNAEPGHLCIFAANTTNATNLRAFNPATAGGTANASAFGVIVAANATAPGVVFGWGTWAMRPAPSGYAPAGGTPSSGVSEMER